MLSDIRKKEIADKEREEAKVRKMKQSLIDAQESNKRLVAQKQLESDRQKEEALDLRQRFLKEAEENERDKAAFNEKKRAEARKMKLGLDQQMAVTQKGRTRTSKEALTEIELKINQDIIKKIEQDPDLQEKIIERLKAAPERKNAGFKYG